MEDQSGTPDKTHQSRSGPALPDPVYHVRYYSRRTSRWVIDYRPMSNDFARGYRAALDNYKRITGMDIRCVGGKFVRTDRGYSYECGCIEHYKYSSHTPEEPHHTFTADEIKEIIRKIQITELAEDGQFRLERIDPKELQRFEQLMQSVAVELSRYYGSTLSIDKLGMIGITDEEVFCLGLRKYDETLCNVRGDIVRAYYKESVPSRQNLLRCLYNTINMICVKYGVGNIDFPLQFPK